MAAQSDFPLICLDLLHGVPLDLDDPGEDCNHHVQGERLIEVGFGVSLAVEASRKAAYCDLCKNFHVGVIFELLDKFH